MKVLTIQEILDHIPYQEAYILDDSVQISSVEFDSRKVTEGSLFVPLTGGSTDGHTYIDKAISQGASVTFWSSADIEMPADKVNIIVVEDTLVAFQQLATYYRQLINPVVVGVTGSNGKTTTKDMTSQVLIAKYHVHKTQGNYNNEIGLPYTLLQMPAETQVAVIEMGMSNFGEIEHLSRIAQPNIAAITLIGESHLEFLGSRQGIAQAKLEILQGLVDGGSFIYPHDEPLIHSEMPTLDKAINCVSFGLSQAADVYAYDLIEDQNKTFFKTNLDENVICMIPVMGSYNVTNALIALSVARELQVPMEQAIFQLSQFELTANRLEWLSMPNGAQVLNDAYNASPTSMKAVLKTLSRANIANQGRKIAVLGDIRELGPESARYHEEIAEAIDVNIIDRVYLFGPNMIHLYRKLTQDYVPENLFYEEVTHQVLIDRLKADIQSEDIVLVKSSFGVDLLQVVTAITGQKTK